MVVKAAVVGATGYAGAELVRILSGHPHAELTMVTSRQHAGTPFSDVYPAMTGVVDLKCKDFSEEALSESADVIFTALPHKASMSVVPGLTLLGQADPVGPQADPVVESVDTRAILGRDELDVQRNRLSLRHSCRRCQHKRQRGATANRHDLDVRTKLPVSARGRRGTAPVRAPPTPGLAPQRRGSTADRRGGLEPVLRFL